MTLPKDRNYSFALDSSRPSASNNKRIASNNKGRFYSSSERERVEKMDRFSTPLRSARTVGGPWVLLPLFFSILLIVFFLFPITRVYGQYPPPGGSPPPPPSEDCDCSDPGASWLCPDECETSGTDCGGGQVCDDPDCGASGGEFACWPADPGPVVECHSAADCGGTCDCGSVNETADCHWACGAGGCYEACGGGGDGGGGPGASPSPTPPGASPSPPPCVNVPPDRPVLLSPGNGAAVSYSQPLTLDWADLASWGVNCSGNNNHYAVYLDHSATPGTQIAWNDEGNSSFPITFALENGTTYYWQVTATNGNQVNYSDVWSFSVSTDPWFQVQGGSIHSDSTSVGNTIADQIPTTCTAGMGCKPYLLLSDVVSGYSGVLSRAGGQVSLGEVTYPTNLSENASYRWRAETGLYDGLQADYNFYNYFLEKETQDWGGTSYPGDGVWQTTTDDDVTIGGWSVAAGEKVVILHGGNVNINNTITVAEGGSLVLIASGTVAIASTVTSVQGIYIVDIINTGAGASQLQVEGSLIGWGSVNLQRDLGSSANTITPAEVVIYRPDIVVNANDALRRAHYAWEEKTP